MLKILKPIFLKFKSKGRVPNYDPTAFKRLCKECNAEEAFSTILNAMTSRWNSKLRRELNEKRTVAIDREYQLIKVKNSSEHHEIVNAWIDLAIKQKRLLVIKS